jgi:O-antigen/teichoic acid export membrane protein
MEKLKSINQLEKIKLVKFAYKYFIGIFIFSILFGLSMKLLFPMMIDSKFSSAIEYIVVIAIAYSFQGMYFMVVHYIFFEKKNHLVSTATMISTIIQIILSYFMIQEFGAIGAAYATLVGFVLNFLIVWYIGSKVYPMPWGFWYEKKL